MSAMQRAVQDVLAAIHQQHDNQDVWDRFTKAVEAAEKGTAEDGNWTLLALAEMLAHPHCPFPALLCCLCERALSAGGDPSIALGLIVTRLYDTLVHADQFVQACRYQMETSRNANLEAAQEVVAADRPQDALGYAELMLSCSGTAPLLDHFAEARQLFRSLPDSETILQRLLGEHPTVAEVARILAGHTDPPMTPEEYEQAVDEALAAIRNVPADDEHALHQALGGLIRAVFCVELRHRNRAVRGLSEIIPLCNVGYTGNLAQLCGSFVEMGADPKAAIDGLLGRLAEVLTLAGRFVDACLKAAGETEEEPHVCIERHGAGVAATLPLEASALNAAGGYCLGVIALLSRSVEKRKEATNRPELLSLAASLAGVSGPANFLTKMLRVLDDEELIVLAPADKRGWRVRIRGIADLFQFHTLLVGRIQEAEIDARAVGVASVLPCLDREATVRSNLQLLAYTAVQADGTVANESEHFIWNEGVPADIPACGGVRVVLLAEAQYARSWSGGRIFRGMRGDVRVEETLDTKMVDDWLRRLQSR